MRSAIVEVATHSASERSKMSFKTRPISITWERAEDHLLMIPVAGPVEDKGVGICFMADACDRSVTRLNDRNCITGYWDERAEQQDRVGSVTTIDGRRSNKFM